MILGPLLLELGTHPVSAAATSGLLVLGSSGSAVLEVWPLPLQHIQKSIPLKPLCVCAF